MPTASELLKQGKNDELWDMCCGYLSLDVSQFMEIQERLLLEQIEFLTSSELGKKLLHGKKPASVEEFRQTIPLTSYADYCPDLLEQREETLPQKPYYWAHSSGRTGEYPFKWIPLSEEYSRELSIALYGIGILSCCSDWGDVSKMSLKNNILFSVGPRPYISGVFADALTMQIPINYLPSLEEAENITFEERLKIGFQQGIQQGLDYFFGLSLVLVSIGEKFKQSSQKVDLKPYLGNPRALFRLAKAKIKSSLAKRQMLPKDLWSVKGIIGSGLDSWVYKKKIAEYWGRPALDLYSCAEGGVIAAQTWDYENMTFLPNLNFLEFIPMDEQMKNFMDRSYQPKTLLLNEVHAGETYEIVITNFHGGMMTRYRLGDMIKIQSLRNKKLGIELPQMTFMQRVSDTIDFGIMRLTEKTIWLALEHCGIEYTDWIAYKEPGQQVLKLFVELSNGFRIGEKELAGKLRDYITEQDKDYSAPREQEVAMDMIGFEIDVRLLREGTFAIYKDKKQAEGADLAHLKPPHINAHQTTLSLLLSADESISVVKRAGKKDLPEELKDKDRVTF